MELKKILFAGIIFASTMIFFIYLPSLPPLMVTVKRLRERTIGQNKYNEYNTTETLSLLEQKQRTNKTTRTANLQRKTNSTTQETGAKNTTKLVLIYTPIFGHKTWYYVDTPERFRYYQDELCEFSNCRLTYDKKELARSDAVLFHGRDMPSVDHMKAISRYRNWKQRWVYFVLENPINVPSGLARYNHFFNWTMTYSRYSDIFSPYNLYSKVQPSEKTTNLTLKNYAQGKDKLAAWVVSHCGTLRDKVVTQLLQYMDVSVYGGCSKKFANGQSFRCELAKPYCSNMLKRFKFYLAFENANCIDYVTEKYWNSLLLHDMVPVVLGPPVYDSKIAIPGSFINVQDFPSIKDLASYLKYLDKNDTAYNMYFQWKARFKVEDHTDWNCRLCKALHNSSLPVKVYDNLGSFWDRKTSCDKYEDKVYKILNS